MQLTLNFHSDWVEHLTVILKNSFGYIDSELPEQRVPHIYYNAISRRPPVEKRQVFLADNFQCPIDLQKGWEKLQQLIIEGNDLYPYLSKFVEHPDLQDAMLDHWGILHFHLGESIDPKTGFIKRTGPLLFAYLKTGQLFGIGIFKHGDWTNKEIIEIMHRNWPEEIRQFRLNGNIIAANMSDSEISAMRNKKVNSFITLSDGATYGALGGGVVSSGDNINTIRKIDIQRALLERLETEVSDNLSLFTPDLSALGCQSNEIVGTKLIITEQEYFLFVPRYDIKFRILKL